MNQVSLEDDLLLVKEVLGGDGHILFAGGRGSHGVQVEVRGGRPQELSQVLGEIFSPRPGRNAYYRKTRVPAQGAATRAAVLDVFSRALAAGESPLLFFVSAHGEIGELPADNYLALWANDTLSARDLTEVMDAAAGARTVRAVITACFSGGFAEMVFQGAEPVLGMGRGNRCGLFAAPWDEVSSGCDPDPARQHHEGYGIHFLNALRGKDRSGRPLREAAIGVHEDEGISLLEAHSYVRVVSSAVDVPTTTSERWLRFTAPDDGPLTSVYLPEEQWVISKLSARLGVVGMRHRAREQLAILEYELGMAEENLANVQEAEFEAYGRLAADLLSRWPVLDDPWHPDFQYTLRHHARSISEFLTRSPAYFQFLRVLAESGRVAEELDEWMRRRAPYARLVRAMNTLHLAQRLKGIGGPAWRRYQELLECERWRPELAQPRRRR